MNIKSEDKVYGPEEDSELLLRHIAECKGKVLDMGCGTGIIGIQASLNGCEVTCADIDNNALELAKQNAELNKTKIKTILTDLFSEINERYDWIIFNPPYLPEDGMNDIQLSGGEKGNELTIKFLEQAKEHLRENGKLLFILCSLSNPEEVYEKMKKLSYKYEISEELKLSWETLFVVKAWTEK